MYWTVVVEMDVPLSRVSLLEKKVQNGFTPVLLIKATAGVSVIGKQTSEIFAS
jgi:hypothetical protein